MRRRDLGPSGKVIRDVPAVEQALEELSAEQKGGVGDSSRKREDEVDTAAVKKNDA